MKILRAILIAVIVLVFFSIGRLGYLAMRDAVPPPTIIIASAGTTTPTVATTTAPVKTSVPTPKPTTTPVPPPVQVQVNTNIVNPPPAQASAPTYSPAPYQPPPIIQIQVPVQPPAGSGSSITNTSVQTPVMPTYEITPPETAPQGALDLLGSHTKTLDEMRGFVVSLNPQIAFKKKMQIASAEELVAYLEKNGYTVVAQ